MKTNKDGGCLLQPLTHISFLAMEATQSAAKFASLLTNLKPKNQSFSEFASASSSFHG